MASTDGSGPPDRDWPAQPTWITERLRLRPPAPFDAARVRELAGDADVARSTLNIPHPYPEGLAETWIASLASAWSGRAEAVWAIEEKASGALVGTIGVHDVAMRHARAEAGYWIGKPYWGRGYATEALRRLLREAFVLLGLHRIAAYHFADNPASGKVMAKAGMRYEGVARGEVFRDGRFIDTAVYACLEDDRLPG